MNPWLPTLIITATIVSTILIIRALAHRGSELAERDWADRIGDGQ